MDDLKARISRLLDRLESPMLSDRESLRTREQVMFLQQQQEPRQQA